MGREIILTMHILRRINQATMIFGRSFLRSSLVKGVLCLGMAQIALAEFGFVYREGSRKLHIQSDNFQKTMERKVEENTLWRKAGIRILSFDDATKQFDVQEKQLIP